MTRWFTVWVEHPGAPVEVVEQWPWLRDVLDAEDLKVHGTSDGLPHATLRVRAPSEAAAMAVARARLEQGFGRESVAGLGASRNLAAVHACLGVVLRSPLSQRRVIDGTTGLVARRLDASSDADRRALDWAAERGCPIWEP